MKPTLSGDVCSSIAKHCPWDNANCEWSDKEQQQEASLTSLPCGLSKSTVEAMIWWSCYCDLHGSRMQLFPAKWCRLRKVCKVSPIRLLAAISLWHWIACKQLASKSKAEFFFGFLFFSWSSSSRTEKQELEASTSEMVFMLMSWAELSPTKYFFSSPPEEKTFFSLCT